MTYGLAHQNSSRQQPLLAFRGAYNSRDIIARLGYCDDLRCSNPLHPLTLLTEPFHGPGRAVRRWERAITDGPLRRLFWRIVDQLDYLVTLARLRILDAVCGPEPEAPADQDRAVRNALNAAQ
jgi:hypothetical protein